MASYVAAYRIGMLVSTAGALFIVSGFESTGIARSSRDVGMCMGAGADRQQRRGEPNRNNPCGPNRRRILRPPLPRDACSGRRVLRIFDPQDALQRSPSSCCSIHRRVFGHHDPPFVTISAFAQRLCRDRQGRRPRRDPDRGFPAASGAALFAAEACGSAACCRRSPISPSPGSRLKGLRSWALAFAITAENFTTPSAP